jgi:hypothetical protein
MGKGIDTGTAFFKGLLGKITDPEQKAAAEKLLANPALMTEIGNGVEGQAEIDRQLAKLRTDGEELTTRTTEIDQREGGLTDWHERLKAWHTQNKAAIEAGAKVLKGEVVVPPITKTGDHPPAGLTQEQFDEHMRNERASFLGYSRDQQAITRDHFTKFNEIVDLEPLLRHPKIAEVGLTGVYELVHKDRLEKFKTDATAAHDKQVADEAVRKYSESQAQMPYPPPTGAGSGSPLDALTANVKDGVVDAATAHYARLQAERNAGAVATK